MDCPLPWSGAGVARAAVRSAAHRSRRDGHRSVRALRAIESATRKNHVHLISERERLNLKEFIVELRESRRILTDHFRQRDDWQRGSWPVAIATKGEKVGWQVARGVSDRALLNA